MPIRRSKNKKNYVEVPVPKEEILWLRCSSCGELIFKKKLAQNRYICPNCGAYFFLTAQERISLLVDKDSFEKIPCQIVSTDPLRFVDQKSYKNRIEEAQKETGLSEAIMIGKASIGGHPVILAVMDFRFIGGSMGSVVGEKFCQAMERAIEGKIPFIAVFSSGGARIQEGVIALLQMSKTILAREKLAKKGILFLAIFTYPTFGGTLASLASLADIIIAEKGAKIGFAGSRVIKQTTKEKLPPGFQTAQFALDHGFVDRIVSREKIREEIIQILDILSCKKEEEGQE
jgi:acetyl-CoA carboxylase carboxyl transferase subunit beta